MSISCEPVAFVRSRFTDVRGMPIQTVAAPEEEAEVVVQEAFEDGLQDIGGFEYLILVTHFHRVREQRLRVMPFLDQQERGVFATRAPARPNRIGLSIVQLVEVRGRILRVRGVDMLDGTPVLDIKPYVPRFDVRATRRIGWFESRLDALDDTRADDRMA